MYPESDPRAEHFDDLHERRKAGESNPVDDPELEELLQLAERLTRDLPDDIPDPVFRENLKQQLIDGETSSPQPESLEEKRWHQRLTKAPWRLSAAAAAILLVAVVAVTMGMGMFNSDDSGEPGDQVAFESLDDEPDSQDDDQTGGSMPEIGEYGPADDDWDTDDYPPFNAEHVVLPPLLAGIVTFDVFPDPDVGLSGASQIVSGTEVPDTAPVYYLSAPSEPEIMLATLQTTLGINGELAPPEGEGEPYRVVDESGETVILWDPSAAFFQFNGEHLDSPVRDFAGDETDPAMIATAFLEQIGFDFSTIQYERRALENGGPTEVQFRPEDLPEIGLDVSLGGSVFVDDTGAIQKADLHWLSLVGSRDVSLSDHDELMEALDNGVGYTPPIDSGTDESNQMMIDVDECKMVHVLTRKNDDQFVLQPAIKLIGQYRDEVEPELPGPARYVVPAIDDD